MSGYNDVLIVEDDDTLGQVLARNLEKRGVKVRVRSSVGEALAAIAVARPDLIVLDINLPDRSGWELLRALRARGIEIPSVVISAARCTPARLEEFHPIANLPKPFPLEVLLRIVRPEPVGAERLPN